MTSSAGRTADCLRGFYAAAPGLSPPPKPMTWLEVAKQLKRLYESLAGSGR